MTSKRGRPSTFNAREVGKLAYLLEGLKAWFENENEALKEITKKGQRAYLLAVSRTLRVQIELHVCENLQNHNIYDVVSKSLDFVLKKSSKEFKQETRDGYNDYVVSNVQFDTSQLKSPAGVAIDGLSSWFEANYTDGEGLNLIHERRNLLKGNYGQSDVNAVWCSDTTIREGLFLTLIIDTASRYVIGSFISESPPKGEDMILFVNTCIANIGEKPKIFHSDQGAYYTCHKFAGFLKELGIEQSVDVRHEEAPGNQIMESFNSKLWSFLNLSKKNGPGLKEFALKTFKSNTYLVQSAIMFFNETQPIRNRDYTPRALFEALQALNIRLELEAKSSEPLALTIRKFHDFAVQKQAVEKMFEDASFRSQKGIVELEIVLENIKLSKNETLEEMNLKLDHLLNYCGAVLKAWHIVGMQQKIIIDKQDLQHKEELKTREILQKEIEEKSQINALLNENLTKTLEELALARAERERDKAEREERRMRRKNAEHRPLRAPLEEDEIKEILDAVKGETPVLASRDRIAILLMIAFGLRISNVMFISVGQLKSLKQGHNIEIKQLKDRTNKPFRLSPSPTVINWFEAYHNDFKVFFNGSNLEDNEPFIKLSREYLNRRINGYFKIISDKKQKYIRSHSARITLGTKVVAEHGITAAKNILGHKSIASTIFYDRNSLTPQEQKAIYDSVMPEAPKAQKRAGRKPNALLKGSKAQEKTVEDSKPKKRGRPKKPKALDPAV